MPYLFIHDYDTELIDMNPEVHHLYIEAHTEFGGERKIRRLRQIDRGLPLTLRENYGDSGNLSAATEQRDITKIEVELQNIGAVSRRGNIVCVPLTPLTNELLIIEKLSPKVVGYLLQRMASVGMRL